MSESQIAYNLVLPYLQNIGFKNEAIEGYGRVPVQIGTGVVWADFVCNIYISGKKKPFAVIEVKEDSDENVMLAIPQAESYAQRLGAPFFCCTNGKTYVWFMTGLAQGDYIQLSNHPVMPLEEYLKRPEKIYISTYLYEAIHNYESAVEKQQRIYENCKSHHETTQELSKLLWDDTLLKNKVTALKLFDINTMQSRGKSQFIENIGKDYQRFLHMLQYLKDDTIPIEDRINNCNGVNSKYGIPGGGPFYITQIIAGLFPDEYTVIEQNAINALLKFKLVDIFFSVNNANEYIYFNTICRELYKYFRNPFRFNLSYVHNFLWHYEREFSVQKSWD